MGFIIRACVFLAIVAVGSAGAQTIVQLNPGRETTLIQQSNPNQQLANARGDVFVGRTDQDGQNAATISIRRGLIFFDLAAVIPFGQSIISATLTLRDVQGLNGTQTVSLHRTLQDWGEGNSFVNGGGGTTPENGDATWLYRFFNASNPSESTLWNTPGGSFSAGASASTSVTPNAGTWFSWSGPGLVSDLQFWLDSPSSNFGWTILGNESQGQTAKRFNSGEAAGTAAFTPVLEVTYIPEPATSMLVALGGCAAFAAARRRRGT